MQFVDSFSKLMHFNGREMQFVDSFSNKCDDEELKGKKEKTCEMIHQKKGAKV